MILSPISTAIPPHSLPGCNKSAFKRPGISRSTSSQSTTTRPKSSAAIDIPSIRASGAKSSLGFACLGDENENQADGDVDEDDNDEQFIGRLAIGRNHQGGGGPGGFRDLDHPFHHHVHQRHASAPDESPFSKMLLSTSVPSSFTFVSKQKPNTTKKEQDMFASFLDTMDCDYWKSVSTIRTSYFFDGIGRGGGFLAIPHLASHGNAKTNAICRLLEAWLTRKLVEPTISDSIPVLEDDIHSTVLSIEQELRQENNNTGQQKIWSGISKALIHIRCGHVFNLDTCCDDETVVHLGADEFYQDYPLFVDVEIKMHCGDGAGADGLSSVQGGSSSATAAATTSQTEVLIVFENIVEQSKTKNLKQQQSKSNTLEVPKSSNGSINKAKPYVHRVLLDKDLSTAARRQSVCTPGQKNSVEC